MKTFRPPVANLASSCWLKRTVKICFGLIGAAFLLQFYYVRELLFAEALVALVFFVMAVIGALWVVGCIAASSVQAGIKSVGARLRAQYTQPFANKTIVRLSEAQEEVRLRCKDNPAICN